MDHFVYLSEVDVSEDSGRGINEREFVRALLDGHGDLVTCVLPQPTTQDGYRHDDIEYVTSHGGAPLSYALHLGDSYRRLRTLHARRPVSGLVTRLEVAPLVPLLARRNLSIPIILKTLAVYGVFGRHDRIFRPHRLISRAMKPLFRSVIEGCLVADTVGEAMAEWVRDRFDIPDERLSVIPNGANTDLFVPGDPTQAKDQLGLGHCDFVIGYVGILGPDRGLEFLIDQVEGLRGDDIRVGLLLVGDGPTRSSLEQRVRRRGLAREVIFHGHVGYDAVPAIIRALDLGVDLSLIHLVTQSGRSIPASFSQKLAQYLATGVPVIAWSVPDTRFVAEANLGVLVPPDDPAFFQQGVRQMACLARRERQELRTRCRTYAENKFSVRKLTSQRVALWQRHVGS